MKELDSFKLKAGAINNSISLYSNKANECFDEIERLESCMTEECESRKDELYNEARAGISKLGYEHKNLDVYGEELKACTKLVCTSGFFI